MLKELSLEEMIITDGGTTNPDCYEFGRQFGKAFSAAIAAYGIYCLGVLL